MKTLEDSLRTLIEANYGSVSAFAKRIDSPVNSVYNALSRGMANTRTELTDKIYRELNVDWDSAKSGDFRGLRLKTKAQWEEVPLYGSIAAGKPIEMIDVDDTFMIPHVMWERYPNAFLLKVVGDSMNKKIPNGSYALINPTKDVINGKAYAVCVNGFDATIKRVEKLHNGFILSPDSIDPTFEPILYDYRNADTEEITIIGEVVWWCIPFDFVI